MPKKKILMLGWEFPPLINGGLGIACLGLSKAMSKHVDLDFILPKTDPNYVVENVNLVGLNHFTIQDFQKIREVHHFDHFSSVTEVESNLLPYEDGESHSFSEYLHKEESTRTVERLEEKNLASFKFDSLYGEDVNYKVIQFSKFAAELSRTMDFDIIHAHDWMTFLAGVEIKKISGKPLVVHVHSLSFDRGGPHSRGWVYDLEKYAMEEADKVIPVSNYTASIVTGHYGIDRGKVLPVHNGVEAVDAYRQEKSFPQKLVLFLGRVTGQKGPEFFLEIAEQVLKRYPNVRFVMAGSGDRLKRLIEKGAFKKVGNKFHFTGFLDKKRVSEVLAMSDVYCMPSVSEPFGLSALEAAQYGTPAVISRQSGAAEVMNGALKADYWDVQLMADHIVSILEDEALHKKLVDQSLEDLKTLSWDEAAEKINRIYNKYF